MEILWRNVVIIKDTEEVHENDAEIIAAIPIEKDIEPKGTVLPDATGEYDAEANKGLVDKQLLEGTDVPGEAPGLPDDVGLDDAHEVERNDATHEILEEIAEEMDNNVESKEQENGTNYVGNKEKFNDNTATIKNISVFSYLIYNKDDLSKMFMSLDSLGEGIDKDFDVTNENRDAPEAKSFVVSEHVETLSK